MLYKFCFLFILIINNAYSFRNKIMLQRNNLRLNMNPNDMINYLTSIKDYTIITVGEDYKNLEEHMINNTMKVYYVNLNNVFDKNEILTILKKRYNNIETGEDLWIFYRGFFIGSKEDINRIINSKKNK